MIHVQSMVAEPMAFYFAGALREPEIVIVANDELAAITAFKGVSGKVIAPRKRHEVIIAAPDVEEILRVHQQGYTPRASYEATSVDEFPLLSYFGPHSITPAWTVDKNGKVIPTSEYQSLPDRLLDLKGKPGVDEVRARGGIIHNSFDVDVEMVNDAISWLNIEDGEDLRQRLIEECSRWERRFA